MVKTGFKTLNIREEDKDLFIKLNSDWNILNPTMRKNKEEFFRMMMNKFKEQLKKEMQK